MAMGGIHKIRLPHELRECHDLAMTVFFRGSDPHGVSYPYPPVHAR
jgi:hypothetical protein